ncbi:ABC transporter ATP-binding protein [Macellibacteroides fermentans]|jgi:subfamily B ATP-binding cassette protein MsbA|uniref:ATP-binding cassette subfamily B protein/subfamily B ATP-binding cassette protein MsbA n=2 Tax=root TaxID=1 RepID=A0A8E2A0N3_9PORP|nr:ABC transporter ATP-binding protein [Macellibacteroides fermentans]MBP7871583.1 ABC transporter ATP-binding protein [Parabacteroides sp.]MDT3369794.1 ABC transporter ATP-binding protein/permease [Bacteroidota bacterium]HAD02743.1 antibiotic ABC transporter ATP-binding protein [Porphyromonadaceae bacterium]MBP7939114.1 ABC transporter ATP-binding protein [Parabacteroides sp.]MBP8011943.1 ABC transporter ATP-binding protein [Parabacteroides sp.]
MKEFIRILQRFVPPYKSNMVWNIVFNVLSAILNLFSFALIIPILQILFKINEEVYTYMPWSFEPSSWESWKGLAEAGKNNFFWYITNLIETEGGSFTLIVLGVFLVIMTFLKVATMYLAFFHMIPIRTGVVRDIRNQINNKITQLPLGFFSEERKGDIIARISGDVNEIENSIMSSLDMLFKNPILIFIYLTGMILISWQLTVFVLVLLPLAGYIMGQVGKKLKRKSLLGQQQWGDLMSQIEETLSGLRIIKAFNAESKIRNRFEKSNDIFRRTTMKIYRRQQMAHPMSEFLGTATIVIVLWYGGTLILANNSPIDAPTFIYYLVIFYSIINPAKDLSKSVYAIQKGLASMERVDKILKAESDINDPIDPKPISLQKQIEYKNVWFKYQNDWVLKNVNLTIPKGKTVALVGQSGSGKSTLVDLLPRFYDVNEGSITIDGTDIRESTLYDLRGLMGNVNQEAILFNDSFFNNISFGVKNATLEQVKEAARIANAHEFIMASEQGYETNIGDRGGKLSGGQRQRISIARAILKNPPILILDEATSALDTESERLVQEALENLMKNRTTIVIAHRLSTIRNADEICVMHGGEIVERGTHDALLVLDGFYKKLCDMQQF